MSDDDLPDSDADSLTNTTVQRRVDDWLDRLTGFLQENQNWASQHGWHAASAGEVRMDEAPMQEHQVPSVQQPTLRLDSPNGDYALFKPKGLWVIGANGRIDLYTAKSAYIIVDQADQFRSPEWKIFRFGTHPDGVPYEPGLLDELV